MALFANMVRAFKITCTVNFLLATGVFLGFVFYCLIAGRALDTGWGFDERIRRPASWVVVGIYQMGLLLMFFARRPNVRGVHARFVFILLGIIGPSLTLADAFSRGHPQAFDVILVTYIGLSDIAYGLFPTYNT